MRIVCGIFFVLSLAPPWADGQPPPAEDRPRVEPILFTVGSEPVAASFFRVNPKGELEFRRSDRNKIAVPAASLVRWGYTRGSAARPLAVLSGDCRLVLADYHNDGIVRMDDETVRLATSRCGAVSLDRNGLRGLVFSPPPDAVGRDRLIDEIADYDADRDVVYLRNGDRLSTVVLTIDDNRMQLQVEDREVTMELDRVAVVVFDSRLAVRVEPDDARLAVGLEDGTTLWCERPKMAGPEVRLGMAWGDEIRVPQRDIVCFQSRGDRFVYLSNLEPVAYKHVPYLDLEWPYRKDRSVLGSRLRAGDRAIFLQGLGVHSACRLVYRVPQGAARFRAAIALDASAGRRGSVVFRVLLAVDGNWKQAFQSRVVRGGDPPLAVDVDLEGRKGIVLAVDYADAGDELDRANWIDARFEMSESE